MIQTMRKLKSGYINGTRVMLGNLKDFLNTSAITDLSFLGSTEDGYPDRLHPDVQTYLDEHLLRSFSNRSTMSLRGGQLRPRTLRRRMSCKGAIKKTRSINVDCEWLIIIISIISINWDFASCSRQPGHGGTFAPHRTTTVLDCAAALAAGQQAEPCQCLRHDPGGGTQLPAAAGTRALHPGEHISASQPHCNRQTQRVCPPARDAKNSHPTPSCGHELR
ncbi:hypothetical protein KR009_003360 [Drosophila setifemur]|nr:hypothetical protein KR009_003360 [Drosophila setifemur]